MLQGCRVLAELFRFNFIISAMVSLHDDDIEMVLKHLTTKDMLRFASISSRNMQLVYNYEARLNTPDEQDIFFWVTTMMHSPALTGLLVTNDLVFGYSTSCAFAAASGNLTMLKCRCVRPCSSVGVVSERT